MYKVIGCLNQLTVRNNLEETEIPLSPAVDEGADLAEQLQRAYAHLTPPRRRSLPHRNQWLLYDGISVMKKLNVKQAYLGPNQTSIKELFCIKPQYLQNIPL